MNLSILLIYIYYLHLYIITIFTVVLLENKTQTIPTTSSQPYTWNLTLVCKVTCVCGCESNSLDASNTMLNDCRKLNIGKVTSNWKTWRATTGI